MRLFLAIAVSALAALGVLCGLVVIVHAQGTTWFWAFVTVVGESAVMAAVLGLIYLIAWLWDRAL